jgi:hypothetical protein
MYEGLATLMAAKAQPVAVWLDCSEDSPANEAEVMHVLTCITGDTLKAWYPIAVVTRRRSGRGRASSRPR